jgi:Adenylate kinase and related kinases
MKICVIGYGGSGKSRLAITLSKHYFVPVLHIDNLHYVNAHKVIPDDELISKIDVFLDKNSERGWVIDGNYFVMDDSRRFQEADLIIFLSYPRWFCYKKAKKRTKNKLAIDLHTNPCQETFSLNYVYWLLFGGRSKKMQRLYQKAMNKSNGKKIIFKTEDELKSWLANQGIALL